MEFRLPELGEGVTEGELVKWRVKVGDQVVDDQPLCEVMTDKATIEIPSHFKGKISELVAKEGEIVKVHQLMLKGEGAGGSTNVAHTPGNASVQASTAGSVASKTVTVAVPEKNMTASSVEVSASPSTRKLAREKGIDLGSIRGSGPHGRILREDLEDESSHGLVLKTITSSTLNVPEAFKAPIAGDEQVIRVPIRGMRRKIAEKMRLSKDKAAHFTYVEEADATELVKLRTRAKAIAEKRGIKMSYLPFVMKAMVEALKQHPRINSTVDEAAQELVIHKTYNISLSVQTEEGLTVPVIKHVENKGIFELAKEIAEVVDRARKKKLTAADFQGSTITLTNAGSIGGVFATPIINYPEVAILGFNKISRKPVVRVVNGRERLAIRDWTYFAITLDHRMIDGAEAAEFMKTFIEYIENPALLVLG